MSIHAYFRVLLATSLIALAGCGGMQANEIASQPPQTAGEADSAGSVKSAAVDGFRLNVLSDSYLPGSSASYVRLLVEDKGTEILAKTDVQGAQNLRALYFDLTYDDARYTPKTVEISPLFGEPAKLLTLSILNVPGKVYHGQVLIKPQEATGFSGDGVMATVHFLKQPLDGSRAALEAPDTQASAAKLTFDQSTEQLKWGYASQGDYDQNSETNLADLTPIAVHFKEVGPFDYWSIQSVIDGDSNGEINLADITPVGVNFSRRVTDYGLYKDASLERFPAHANAVSLIPRLLTVGYAAFTGNRTSQRIYFSLEIPDEATLAYYWVRPADGSDEGIPSNTLYYDGHGQILPVSFFTATPQAGPIPLNVSFNAALSNDPDGILVDYEWDFDGDGVFDETDNGESAARGSKTPTHVYDVAGTYDAALKVTDENGISATSSRSISANAPNNTPPVAAITASPTSGQAPLTVKLDASGSYDPDGTIVLYEWDFDGDGMFEFPAGTQPDILHTYTATGNYNAAVRVTDNGGASAIAKLTLSSSGTITVTQPNLPPQAAISADVTSGAAPLTVNLDASYSFDPDGTIVKYEWDYQGDGTYDADTGTVPTSQFVFTAGGHFNPTVRVTDNAGATDTASLTESAPNGLLVNLPPVAAITGSPLSGNAPLTVDFDASQSNDPDGAIAKFEWDLDGDGIFELDTGTTPTAQNTYTVEGYYNPAVRVTDYDGAMDVATLSDSASVLIAVGTPPVAALAATPLSGDSPLDVDFDASGSTPLGSIASFEWDLDGDGVFERNTGTTPTTSYTYGMTGTVHASVKVTATNTLTDTASVDIAVTNGWDTSTIAVSNVSINSKLSVEKFAPWVGLAYKDASTNDLYFMRSTDSSATSWETPFAILTAGDAGDDCTLRQINGKPGISFKREGTQLHFIAATSGTGLSWWPDSVEIDAGTDPTAFSSLAYLGGRPLVAEVHDGFDKLLLARGSDPNGSSAWNSPFDIFSYNDGTNIEFTDMLVSGSATYVVFNDVTPLSTSGLQFIGSTDSQGATWNAPVTIDSPAAGGRYPSIELVNGNPAASYEAYQSGELRFARATSGDGSAWGAPLVVDSGTDLGQWTTLRIVDSKPAIAYYDGGEKNLKFAIASDSNGTSWSTMVVDGAGDVGRFATMTVTNSTPVIAYYDETHHNIKIAVLP